MCVGLSCEALQKGHCLDCTSDSPALLILSCVCMPPVRTCLREYFNMSSGTLKCLKVLNSSWSVTALLRSNDSVAYLSMPATCELSPRKSGLSGSTLLAKLLSRESWTKNLKRARGDRRKEALQPLLFVIVNSSARVQDKDTDRLRYA